MYEHRGLGIAPAVAAGLISAGGAIVSLLGAPSEQKQLQMAARGGNLVAWWRLRSNAEAAPKNLPPASYPPEPPGALSQAEKNALVMALGPGATAPLASAFDNVQRAVGARALLWELVQDGTEEVLAAKSYAALSETPGVQPADLPPVPATPYATTTPASSGVVARPGQAGLFGGIPLWAVFVLGGGLLFATTRKASR